MYRIVLVDDEPLILAGIASLVNWEDYDCTIVGKATNGPSAYDMILELQPDILITDIRMPVLNGLELVEKCQQAGCAFAFIVLTNLEEFQLVRKALSLGASDYLVKLDLDPQSLTASLARAKENCDLLVKKHHHQAMNSLVSKDQDSSYFSSLLLMGEDAPVPSDIQNRYTHPFTILFSLEPTHISFNADDTPLDFNHISQQLMDIVGGISSRTFQASTMLNYDSHTYLLAASLKDMEKFTEDVRQFCQKCITALKTYFELRPVFGISMVKNSARDLPLALRESSTALEYYYYNSASPIVFYEGQTFHKSRAHNFNINFLKKDLSASIQQNDSQKMQSIFDQIIELFEDYKPNKEPAISVCINIYTYLYSFFDKDDTYQDIFPYTINIASQLKRLNSLSAILEWLQIFCGKLCRLLDERKENRSDKVVDQAKSYIEEHYQEKLTLTEIADTLNISSGYLSNNFKKFTGMTLSDYIAHVKIEHAKELIDTHQYLMYEISDMLGFDNPYYFSKVFKKVTGISPREHEKRQ